MALILITGGAGFIGSHLNKKLIKLGHKTIVIDNLSTGNKSNLFKNSKFLNIDISIEGFTKKLPNKIDYVYHLAAQSSGQISYELPLYDFKANSKATLELLQWSQKNKIKRFIFTSSMNVYGNIKKHPVAEIINPEPISFYGIGKYTSENHINLFANMGLQSTIFRLFNVYGPGQNIDNLKQGMISIYLNYLKKNKPIIVKGSLNRFRDFIYIDDVVDALIKGLKQKNKFDIFNVCSNKKYTIKQLLDIVLRSFGNTKHKINIQSGTPLDQFGIYGSNYKIKSKLKWTPKTNLNTGVKKMLKYYNIQFKDNL